MYDGSIFNSLVIELDTFVQAAETLAKDGIDAEVGQTKLLVKHKLQATGRI